MDNDDFYIGYLDKASDNVRRFTRTAVIGCFAGTVIVAFLLVLAQKSFYPSTFEFLQYKTFEGTLHAHPYPMLQVLLTDTEGGLPSYSHYYLVNEGKFGSQELVAEYEGKQVKLEGTLIYRDDQVMIEIKAGTLALSHTGALPAPQPESLGTFTLTGEIVDSKCFLGVMNPGSEKPHRACAVRCISGGVPPMFVAKNSAGKTSYMLLQNLDGSTVNKAVLDVVAEPLEITGEVIQLDDVLILKADPASYKRIDYRIQ